MKQKQKIIWYRFFLGLTMFFFALAMTSVFGLYRLLYELITFSIPLNHLFVLVVILLFVLLVIYQAIGNIKMSVSYIEFENIEEDNRTTIAKIYDLFNRVKMLIITLIFFVIIIAFFIDSMDIDFLLQNYAMGLFFVLAVVFFFVTAISLLITA